MEFMPGIDLNRAFYYEAVAPLIKKNFPDLKYSAALMGCGSDVLGFDNPTSMDHNWGPRFQIFLSEDRFPVISAELNEMLRKKLQFEFKGFPVNFTPPRYDHTQSMEPVTSHPVNHLIEIVTSQEYLRKYLEIDTVENLTVQDWKKFPEQKLLELTAGAVFHDGLKSLVPLRDTLRYYPPEIRLLRMSELWQAVWEEEAFIGRNIELGESAAVKIISVRVTEIIIRLCFCIERTYAPYSKWLLTALRKLRCYPEISTIIDSVLYENDPLKIETALCALYEKTVELHNNDEGLPRLENKIRDFFGRPYRVIFAETIVEKLHGAISDKSLFGK